MPANVDGLMKLGWVAHEVDPQQPVKRLRKTPRVVVGRIASLTQLVVSCVGFGIMPSALIADELASGALLRILPDDHDHKIPMLAVYGYQNIVPLKVRAFLGYMKANLHFPAGD